ncbi:MAG: PKD domain-containing protein [Thermoplasmatales archaeon]|nr:PKD domain-containing protein [Thermoplasmatales archaeon]
MRKTQIFVVLILLASLFSLPGKAYTSEGEFGGVAKADDGNIIVVGYVLESSKYVMTVEKYDAKTGSLIWNKKFSRYSQNIGKAVVVDANGNIYAGGVSGSEFAGIEIPSTDYLIVKYDKNGREIWNKTYDNGFADFLMDMAIDEDNNVYATGMTLYFDIGNKNLSNIDFWTIKIGEDGKIIKQDKFDEKIDAGFGIDVRGNKVIVTGTVQKEEEQSKYCTLIYNKDLFLISTIYYETGICSASDVAIFSDGSFAVTGSKDDDILTVIYDSNGNKKKEFVEGGSKKDDALAISSDGINFVIGGLTTENVKKRWYIAKYNQTSRLWVNGTDVEGEVKRVLMDASGIYAVGYKKIQEGVEIPCIRKYSSDGAFLWEGKATQPQRPLSADFRWLPSNPTRADVVNFYDSSTGEINSWHWDFGDGSTSNEKNPKHQYSAIGKFNVTLTVRGASGEDTITKEIYISNSLPFADFDWNPKNPVEKENITFDASKSYDLDGYIVNYTWQFGDGSVGYGKEVIHAYNSKGNYTVNLTVLDNDGGEKKITKPIIVSEVGANPPSASFTIKERAGKGEVVIIDASDSYDIDGYIVNYTWYFGDGTNATTTQPIISHTWYKDGEYNVTLIVEDDEGYKSSYSRVIIIGGPPDLRIYAPNEIKCEKNKEKSFKINISCAYQPLYYLNFSFDIEGDIEVIPKIENFNISAGSSLEIEIKVIAKEKGEIKIKSIGKYIDIENNIENEIESNEAIVAINLSEKTPSFELIAFIFAIIAILIIRRRK